MDTVKIFEGMMKILVACEFSGIVRDAFKAKGHDAWSCDLLSTESPGNHIQGDVLEILNDGWDMMIGFPPCTYLSNAGIRWFNEEKYGEKARERKRLRVDAYNFVMKLANANISKIAIENPVGWLNSHWRKPDQIIHPYYFGDPIPKKTCLWLKNLPVLKYGENIVEPEYIIYNSKSKKCGKSRYSKLWQSGKNRRKERSKTFPGIAKAMAEQWG